MNVDDLTIRPSEYDDIVVAVLESWVRTPYRERDHAKKNGVNCLGLVVKALDELFSVDEPTDYPHLNAWDAIHRRELAVRLVRVLVRGWHGSTRVWESNDLEAGDVILVRATKHDNGDRNYGHCMIVGSPDWIYHALRGPGVVRQAPHQMTREVIKVYRPLRKELW